MLPNREGQRVPQATFRTRTEAGEWKNLTTEELFKGKTVVVFSLPYQPSATEFFATPPASAGSMFAVRFGVFTWCGVQFLPPSCEVNRKTP